MGPGRDGVERATVKLAPRAVGKVRDGPDSEPKGLWEEAGQPGEWYEALAGVLARLGH